MIEKIELNRQAIADACASHHVVRLDIFGSALRADFTPGASDIDFLVEFGPLDSYARVDAYFGMLPELQRLLGTKVDLVMIGAVRNPYVIRDIERTQRPLYPA